MPIKSVHSSQQLKIISILISQFYFVFESFFLVDESCSSAGGSWKKTRMSQYIHYGRRYYFGAISVLPLLPTKEQHIGVNM